MRDYDALCRSVQACSSKIKSVRIADGLGRLAGCAYREGLVHRRDNDAERCSLQSVRRAIMRENFESTNGRLRYSISVYENLTRATVPLAHEGEDKFYLLLSFDASERRDDNCKQGSAGDFGKRDCVKIKRRKGGLSSLCPCSHGNRACHRTYRPAKRGEHDALVYHEVWKHRRYPISDCRRS